MKDLRRCSQMLRAAENQVMEVFDHLAQDFHWVMKSREVGIIKYAASDIVRLNGLPGIKPEELIDFPQGKQGFAFNLDSEEVGVILLDKGENIQAGSEVYRTD